MLIHGLIDENVHFRHTSRLINSLIQAKKRYHLLLFPSERHSPQKLQDRIFMGDEIVRFFSENLPVNVSETVSSNYNGISLGAEVTRTLAGLIASTDKVFSKM